MICLSDDEDGDEKSNTPVSTPAKQQQQTTSNGEKKIDPSHSSDWLVQRKDIIRIPELSIKHADLVKKHLEIACSAVCFGMVEYHVEAETISLRETDFELKLKGRKRNLQRTLYFEGSNLGGSLDNLNIKLAYSDIVSFYFSYQSRPPAAFIQVRPDFAELFHQYIPSADEQGKQFDPKSNGEIFLSINKSNLLLLDERRRRIVLCLQNLKPDMEKSTIASIYHYLKAKSSTMVNLLFLTFSKKVIFPFRMFVV